jgi:hypothetical protein
MSRDDLVRLRHLVALGDLSAAWRLYREAKRGDDFDDLRLASHTIAGDNYKVALYGCLEGFGVILSFPSGVIYEQRVPCSGGLQSTWQHGVFFDFSSIVQGRAGGFRGRSKGDYDPKQVESFLGGLRISYDGQEVLLNTRFEPIQEESSRDAQKALGRNFFLAERWVPVQVHRENLPLVTHPMGYLLPFRGRIGVLTWGTRHSGFFSL